MTDGELILVAGALLTAGLAASLLAGRLRLPGLVLFLGLGMALGSDGLGWIDFSDYGSPATIGIVALALILFEGGLTAGFGEIRPVLRRRSASRCVGTLVTAVISGLAATWLFDFTLLEGLLLGSIVASTDGAAIFALLRGSTLRRRLARTLEGEAGFNDPVAVLLVVGFIDWIQQPDYGVADMAVLFVEELGDRRARSGVAVGWLAVQALQRMQLASGRPLPGRLDGDGGDRVRQRPTRCTVGLPRRLRRRPRARQRAIPAKRTIAAFHEGLAWVAQLAMFLVLGLLVFPSQLGDVALEGTVARARARAASRGRWRRSSRPRSSASACAERPCSAGPGCAGRCRSCSRRSR